MTNPYADVATAEDLAHRRPCPSGDPGRPPKVTVKLCPDIATPVVSVPPRVTHPQHHESRSNEV
jgi:hypothetical protein